MPVPNYTSVRVRLRKPDQPGFLLRLVVIALIVILSSLYFLNNTTPASAGSCAQDPNNLLLNGTMRAGPKNNFGVVAKNWSGFVLSPQKPHFENAGNEGYDPNGSQYIWADSARFDAGIYQTVSKLTPGQTYHYWLVWGQALQDIGGVNKRKKGIDRQIGVDVTGGTDPSSPTVQWSVYYDTGSGFNRPEWHLYFKAPGTTATFFLRAINTLRTGRDKVFFDTACLFAAPNSPTTTPWATTSAGNTPVPSATPTRTQQPAPLSSPTATRTATRTATAAATSTAPVAPTPDDPSVIWDARLPALNVSLQPANVAPGTLYWKLTRLEYDDPYQHCGDFGSDHDMYFVLTDQNGGKVVNQHVWQGWPDGTTDAYSDTRGIADIALWSNYDPTRGPGPYFGWVDGLPSDVVTGMGLPLRHHVSFVMYFRKTIASPYTPRTATPTGPWASPVPSLTPTLTCRVSSTVTPTRVGGSTATPTRTLTPSVVPPDTTSTPTATSTATVQPPPVACSIRPLTTISVGAKPKGVAVDPVTNRVFVGLAASSSVAVLDANTNKLIATWATDGLGNTNGIAFSQNKLFVTKRNNASVSVVNATTGAFVKNIPVGNAPYGIGANGASVWAANFNDGTVSLLNPATNTKVRNTTVGGYPAQVAPLNDHAYVTTYGTGVVDLDANGFFLHALSGITGAFGVAANPTTNRVYVSNRDTNSIAVINAASDTLSATFTESATPYALAVNPNTNHLFIVLADSNSVRVRDVGTWNLLANISIGTQGTNGGDSIGLLNGNVYVANTSAGTVSVIADCAH